MGKVLAQPSVGTGTDGDARLDEYGIFKWYRYTQDFDPDFVASWIRRVAPDAESVCDPFLGSGTTTLAARFLGLPSTGVELNPFMSMVCRVKADWDVDLDAVEAATQRIADAPVTAAHARRREAIYESDELLRKWIDPEPAAQVVALHDEIARIEDHGVREFLLLALARDLLAVSNMTLRPNICYKGKRALAARPDVRAAFRASASQMVGDVRRLPGIDRAPIHVVEGDARHFSLPEGSTPADVVVTSPPYPNDMEYVHQTRLELAFLGIARGRRDLKALKQRMISSSVKLVYRDNDYQASLIEDCPLALDVVARLDAARNKDWGWDASRMAAHYFGGMRLMIRRSREAVRPGGHCLLVVGDSAFNGVDLPTDRILEEIGVREGFTSEGIEAFRPRWNSKHDSDLAEMVVILQRT